MQHDIVLVNTTRGHVRDADQAFTVNWIRSQEQIQVVPGDPAVP